MRFKIVFIFVALLFLTGCASTYSEQFFSAAKQRGWTEDQQLAAWIYSYRLLFGDQTDDGQWVMDYSKMDNSDVIASINAMRSDLNQILSDISWLRLARAVDMEDALLREEAKLNTVRKRLILGALNQEFFEKIGETEGAKTANQESLPEGLDRIAEAPLRTTNERPTINGEVIPIKPTPTAIKKFSGGYDIRILWPQTDLSLFLFEPTYVKEARASGQLHEFARYMVYDVEASVEDIAGSIREFGIIKTPVEEDAFIVIAQKIFDPESLSDKQMADVVEVYRLYETEYEEGSFGYRREKQPFMRGYKSLKGSSVDVWVIDVDREDEPGYGLPDEVRNIRNVKTARDLYQVASNDFNTYRNYEKPIERRELPQEKDIVLDIVRSGDVSVDLWQTKESGWNVPFSYYREDDSGNPNYFAKFEIEDRRVLWVGKQWGKVLERFHMKPEYADKVYLRAFATSRHILLEPEGEFEVKASVDVWAMQTPYEIEYTFNDSTYILWDEDGDGVFEKRKVLAK